MISIKGLSFGYKKPYLLFENLSTEFELGKIYGLLGRNGAGKTTLLKLIIGVRYPLQGEIKVFGYDSFKREPQMLADMVIVPEHFSVPDLTPKDFLRAYSGFYPKFDERKFYDLLADFELPENKRLKFLSYGQKKKFLIAFVLSTGARILLMDEPTNGLDIPSKVKFRRAVANYLDSDSLVIISTHQVRDVEGLIDHIKIVEKGRIVFDYSIDYLQERLMIKKGMEQKPESAFYVEDLGSLGYQALLENTTETAVNLDIEFLFNSVIYGDLQKLNSYLNPKN